MLESTESIIQRFLRCSLNGLNHCNQPKYTFYNDSFSHCSYLNGFWSCYMKLLPTLLKINIVNFCFFFYLVVGILGKQNRSTRTGLGINNSVWSNPLVLHFELGEKLIADLKQRIRSILTWCNSLNPATFSVKPSNGVTLFSHERFLWNFEIKCLPLPFQRREVLNEIDLNWCAPPVRLIPSPWITMNMSLFGFLWPYSKWIPDPRKS